MPDFEAPPVLVVEDNPTDLKLVRVLLELEGYTVTTAGSAEEALALLGHLRPLMLLVDIDLPGMSGLDLTSRLRAAPARSTLPILAMSSTAGSDAPGLAAAAGCDGFLVKPIDVGRFPAAIARATARRPPQASTA
jgi:CheY-like chemotaxis protein